MKKVLSLMLVMLMVFALASCSGGASEDPNLVTIGDYKAVYTGCEITKDYDGDDAIIINFDYTNNSNAEQSFTWAFFYEITQNDKALEYSTVFVSEDSYETVDDTASEDVAPGESASVSITYKLNDLTSPINMEFSDLFETSKDSLTIDITEAK